MGWGWVRGSQALARLFKLLKIEMSFLGVLDLILGCAHAAGFHTWKLSLGDAWLGGGIGPNFGMRTCYTDFPHMEN